MADFTPRSLRRVSKSPPAWAQNLFRVSLGSSGSLAARAFFPHGTGKQPPAPFLCVQLTLFFFSLSATHQAVVSTAPAARCLHVLNACKLVFSVGDGEPEFEVEAAGSYPTTAPIALTLRLWKEAGHQSRPGARRHRAQSLPCLGCSIFLCPSLINYAPHNNISDGKSWHCKDVFSTSCLLLGTPPALVWAFSSFVAVDRMYHARA